MLLLIKHGATGGHISRPAPQIIACAFQGRVNFYTSTSGPANVCRKTGHYKRFSMKQQARSIERD